jgi:hypothetical protein
MQAKSVKRVYVLLLPVHTSRARYDRLFFYTDSIRENTIRLFTIELFQMCSRSPTGTFLRAITDLLCTLFIGKQALILENLALRQQLTIYLRKEKRAERMKPQHSVFWVLLSQVWGGWKSSLVIVKPDTVIGWHQEGF